MSTLPPNQLSTNSREESNYPISRTIKYMTSAARYTYEVIEEGIQPPESYLARTLKPNAFSIPDGYIVETTYGKAKNTVTCSVKYIAKKPHFMGQILMILCIQIYQLLLLQMHI